MGKHAYLIEAHNNKSQLESLLKCLDYEENDIFMHIDANSIGFDDLETNNPLKKAKLQIITPISVHWGGFSQILVEVNLLEAALLYGDYCRYHLISGMDLPLKSQDEIHDFFDSRPDTEFVHFDYVNSPDIYQKRMAQFHFLRDKIDRSNRFLCFIEKLSVILQRMLRINRLKDIDAELVKGANWFSITQGCAKYIVDNKEWIIRHFKYTKCCDEVFLQTLVYNSDFKNHLYYDEFEKRYGNLRLTDWKRGNPYIFRSNDFEQLVSSNYIFARKFNENIDNDVIQGICSYLNGVNND